MSRYKPTSPFQNTEQASAWLRELPWGGALLRQLPARPDVASTARRLRIVGDMHRVFNSRSGPPAMFESDDEADILGRPAMAAPLNE